MSNFRCCEKTTKIVEGTVTSCSVLPFSTRTNIQVFLSGGFYFSVHTPSVSISRALSYCPLLCSHLPRQTCPTTLMSSPMTGFLLPPLLLVLHFLYQYLGKLRPLNAIPNAHFTAPFSPIWLLSVRYRKRENRTVWESHKRLGPVIRLTPDEISVCTLQGIKTIYGVWNKDAWYEAMTNYE